MQGHAFLILFFTLCNSILLFILLMYTLTSLHFSISYLVSHFCSLSNIRIFQISLSSWIGCFCYFLCFLLLLVGFRLPRFSSNWTFALRLALVRLFVLRKVIGWHFCNHLFGLAIIEDSLAANQFHLESFKVMFFFSLSFWLSLRITIILEII